MFYAGETVRIAASAQNWDGSPVTPGSGSTVEATIHYGSRGDVRIALEDQALAWDAGRQHWYYDWQTSGFDPGAYRVEVRIVGPGESRSVGVRTIRLHDPDPEEVNALRM